MMPTILWPPFPCASARTAQRDTRHTTKIRANFIFILPINPGGAQQPGRLLAIRASQFGAGAAAFVFLTTGFGVAFAGSAVVVALPPSELPVARAITSAALAAGTVLTCVTFSDSTFFVVIT